jgi:FkbM family methyltransferase
MISANGSAVANPDSIYHLAHTDGTAFDIRIDPHEQDDISVAIRTGPYQFPAMFGLLPALAPSGGRVLDLGAHIGTFALYAAAHGYETLAVEASPHNASLLEASIARNGLGRLTLVNAAISDHAGQVEFVNAGPYGFVKNALNSDPTITVPCLMVDDLLRETGWERVDFVKMDIEGSEPAAVRGMTRLLSRDDAPPILFESNGFTLNLFGCNPADIMVPLENCGYRIFVADEGRLMPVTSTQLQTAVLWDCLAMKRPRAIAGWPVAPPFTPAEEVSRILLTSADRKAHTRQHAALALRGHPQMIASDQRIRSALDALARDPDDGVRAAASWWSAQREEAAPASVTRSLAEKDVEIRRLQALVSAYEAGRFIRLMRWLDAARRRLRIGG